MTSTPANGINSIQDGPHRHLRRLLERHLAQPFQRPIAHFNRNAFERAAQEVKQIGGGIILDAGCGTGASTALLASRFPDHAVVGVDKSSARLDRRRWHPTNCVLVRADLVDFWRLAAAAGWRLERHFLLCPNPWPKSRHIGRRWHGHAVWPDILALGGRLEVRTNWEIYAREFVLALELSGVAKVELDARLRAPLSPFERKYRARGQPIYRVVGDLPDSLQPPTTFSRAEKAPVFVAATSPSEVGKSCRRAAT